ncbi:Replication protein O [Paraburkholderia azotifigens]|uniref:Replication protein O n=1 Tax=Paraburkholderia azotifigens TaxID=2057004 RepID=UPI00317F9D1D
MQSDRTFYRSLSDLEAAGLIERPAQRRYVAAGLFGRAYLHLTERAAILLGLVEAPVVAAEQQTDESEAEAFIQPSDSMADGAIYKDLSPNAFQKRQPGQVPADLQRLRPLGFRDFLIFKLMREAREQGKFLSHVVEATWEHLRQAKRPISYLRTLLRSSTDFSYQIRARAAELEAEQIAAAECAEAIKLVQRLAGQTFVDASGERRFVIDTDGKMLTVYNAGEGVARHDVGEWQVRFARALRSGQIKRAPFERAQSLAVRLAPVDTPRMITATVAGHLAALRDLVRRA